MKHPTTRQTREQRAEHLFGLYVLLRLDRSLEALHAIATGLGLSVSLATLKRYSVDYHWQERTREHEADRQATEGAPAAQVARMNERQAVLGQAAQEIARKSFENIAKQTDAISPDQAIRLAKEGVHIERLAMGEATSRQEIAIGLYSELVEAVCVLFEDVLRLADHEAMRRQFAIGVDRLIDAHIQGAPLDARVIADAESAAQAPASN